MIGKTALDYFVIDMKNNSDLECISNNITSDFGLDVFRFKEYNIGLSISTGYNNDSIWLWHSNSKALLADNDRTWVGVNLSSLFDISKDKVVNDFIIFNLDILTKYYLKSLSVDPKND